MKPRTFLIYDPHLFHDGIIRLCPDTRPFKDWREMNECTVESWRSTVSAQDTVICGGDFAYREPDEKALRRTFDALPGNKILIVGNHDGKATRALPWAAQHDIMYASIDSQNVVLCHYAMRQWPKIRKGALMLYGHSHGKLPGNSQSCDVGVDVMGFAPVRLNTIKDHLATLPADDGSRSAQRSRRRRAHAMMQFFKSMFVGNVVERTIIDGRDPTREAAEAAMKRSLASIEVIENDRMLVARSIAAWARDTIDKRCRQPLPFMMPRSIPIMVWLPGLSNAELSNLKSADTFEIVDHVFRGRLIPGVRAVQPLEEAILKFPPRIAPPEERERYAGGGGGPRKPK